MAGQLHKILIGFSHQKMQEKNPGFFWSCFGLVLVFFCSCIAATEADQKETKRRPEGEKNKTKTKDEPGCYDITHFFALCPVKKCIFYRRSIV